ncbi:hypothetical protein [Luteibacter sp. SG786]|uniref:hypothetical protein n=1 Tax=Luteibacter sp. SG786 TaxID=2587130 RepID=UPI00141F7728|nr:hypothetical protein [Luteibacter sp. SG786]NII55619.1 hypothetical protein [Luteibacter sp. SG786]
MKDDEASPSRRNFLRQSVAGLGYIGAAGMSGAWLMDGAARGRATPAGAAIVRAPRELIMFHGQSNAVGTGGKPALTLQEIYANVTFNGGVRPGTDPAAMTGFSPLVEYDGGHGTGGEVGTNACADGLVEYTAALAGLPFAAQFSRYATFTSGEGGRPIGYFSSFLDDENLGGYQGWKNSEVRLRNMIALMRAEATANAANFSWLATTWQQGEADSTGLTETRSSYASKLTRLERAHWLKLCQVLIPEQAWRPLWLVAQVCSHNSYGSDSAAFCNPFIALAQRDACLASTTMRMVNPQYIFDYFDESELGQPMLHLTNESHRWQGRYFARAIYQLIQDSQAGRALRHPALDMVSATVWSPNTIYVTFNVPAGILTLDTSWVAPTRNHGFDVRDAANTVVPASAGQDNLIAAITVVAKDTLRLSLRTNLPEAATKLTLGWGDATEPASIAGRHGGPRSNIRDSAGDVDVYTASDGTLRPMHNYALVGEVPLTMSRPTRQGSVTRATP